MRNLVTMLVLMPFMALATTWYVDDRNGADSYSGKSQSLAKKTIQAAVDASTDGDTILVAPGTYSAVATGNKAICVIGIEGCGRTIIDGTKSNRCVDSYNQETNTGTTNSVFVGFTLCNGYGGSEGYGGGARNGSYKRCVFADNECGRGGGGAAGAYLENCLIRGNKALDGGGVDQSIVIGCTIVDNSARNNGAVAFNSVLRNCIAYQNEGPTQFYEVESWKPSLVKGLIPTRINVFESDPNFVDAPNGDYRLAEDSQCIDAGENSCVVCTADLDGNARIVNGIVDIGCYEYTFGPQTYYVNAVTGLDSNTGLSAALAKKTIQAAVDASTDGDTILVASGTYSAVATGNKAICVIGIEGCGRTIIDGAKSNRCVDSYNQETNTGTTNSVFVGFTLCNGYGGSEGYGGGARNGSYKRCVFADNECGRGGGGAAGAYLENCLIRGNKALDGGGVDQSIVIGCTIVDNSARNNGAVAFNSVLRNCIAYQNEGPTQFYEVESWKPSLVKGLIPTRINVFESDPNFVDAPNGDYRLATGSPCIDVGDNSYVLDDADLDAKARIVNGIVDIGCYEYAGGDEPIVHTVTFDANGGTCVTNSVKVSDRAAVGELPNASRSNYDFLGWFTAAVGGEQVSSETVVTADVAWYAHWQEQVVEPTIYTVQFNANGGSCARTSVEVEDGVAVGTLPTATRDGYDFLGWFTAANGGTQVSASTVVTDDTTWYAHWQEQTVDPVVPPVDPGDNDEPMDASIANTYDGVIVDADGLPMGYINVKTARATGKGDAKVSKVTATIQMAGEAKKLTVKASVPVAEAAFTQAASDGRVLDLSFSRYGIWGTFDGYEIDGVRNLLTSMAKSDKGTDAKAAAESIVDELKGNYVMAYEDENGWNGLSVSVMAKGKVKVSGKLANGTSVSTSTQLIVGDEYSVIPVFYTKGTTSLAFNVYYSHEDGEMSVFGYYDAVISPVTGLDSGLSFYLGESIYDLFEDYTLLDEYLPEGLSVEPSGSKLIVDDGAKAGKIVWDKKAGGINESKSKIDGYNVSALKLTFTAKTGTFKGSFKAYAIDEKDSLKTFTATVSGVVVDGIGYGVATIKKIGSFAVAIAE